VIATQPATAPAASLPNPPVVSAPGPPATQPTSKPTTQPAVSLPNPPTLIPWATTKALLAGPSPVVLPAGDYEIQETTRLRGEYDFTAARFVASKPCIMFRFADDHVRVKGGVCDSIWPITKPKGANPKVGVVGYVMDHSWITLDHPTFRNVDDGWMIDPGAGHLTVLYAHGTNEVRGDVVYCGGGDESLPRGPMLVKGLVCDDSEQEHDVRISTPGFTGGVWIDCTLTNTNHKEPLALRAARDQMFVNLVIHSDMGVYVGESNPVAPGSEPAGLSFFNPTLAGGGYWSIESQVHDVLIDGGSTEIRADLVPANLCPRVIGISANSAAYAITLQNHTRKIFGAGYDKPWYLNWSGFPDAKAFIDGGGNQTANIAQPETPSSH
jgi:hypothetical protein